LNKNQYFCKPIFNNQNFNNLNGYQNSLKNKTELTEIEKNNLK